MITALVLLAADARAQGEEAGARWVIAPVVQSAPGATAQRALSLVHRVLLERLWWEPAQVPVDMTVPTMGEGGLGCEGAYTQGRRSLVEGLQAFRGMELQSAAEAFGRATDFLWSSVACHPELENGLAMAQAFLGAVSEIQGDSEQSRRAFYQAVRLDPTLDPAVLPDLEPFVEQLDQARGSLAAAPTGSIVVESPAPSGPRHAAVIVNGTFVGLTPITLDGIPAGKHAVQVAAEGYGTFGEGVEVRPGADQKLKPPLQLGAYAAQLSAEQQAALRGLSEGEQSGPTAQLARQVGAHRVALVSVQTESTLVRLKGWLVDGESAAIEGRSETTLEFSGAASLRKARSFAAQLLGGTVQIPEVDPSLDPLARQWRLVQTCMSDADCGSGFTCEVGAGRCERILSADEQPFYRRWWFWTAVATGFAAGVVGMAVALQPDPPKGTDAPVRFGF